MCKRTKHWHLVIFSVTGRSKKDVKTKHLATRPTRPLLVQTSSVYQPLVSTSQASLPQSWHCRSSTQLRKETCLYLKSTAKMQNKSKICSTCYFQVPTDCLSQNSSANCCSHHSEQTLSAKATGNMAIVKRRKQPEIKETSNLESELCGFNHLFACSPCWPRYSNLLAQGKRMTQKPLKPSTLLLFIVRPGQKSKTRLERRV